MSERSVLYRHLFEKVPIEEYFDSTEELGATLAAVSYKVVAVFLKATDPQSGRSTGKGNYISGLEGDIDKLTRYVAERVFLRREFGLRDLPVDIVGPRRQREVIAERVRLKLISLALVIMRDEHNLWYMDGDWCFSNVLRAEHDRIARIIREKGNTYHGDKRNFHGRPSKQGRVRARRLRIAPGTSIGGQQ